MSKILLGFYTSGMMLNWTQMGDDLLDAGLNGSVHHLMTPWSGLPGGIPFYPFRQKATGKFDLKSSGMLNDEYFAKLDEANMEYAKRKLILAVCLWDVYMEEGNSYPWIGNKHPFRQNNISESLLPKEKSQAFYNNRIGSKLYWLDTLSGGDENDPSTYKPNNALGYACEVYVDAVIASFMKAKTKYPHKAFLVIRSFNEERGLANPNPPPHYLRTYGDESHIDMWIDYKLRKLGLRRGKDFIQSNDWFPYAKLSSGSPAEAPFRKGEYMPAWNDWRGAGKWINDVLHGLHEVHSVEDMAVAQKYIQQSIRGNLWLSSDGGRENDPNWFKDQFKLKVFIKNSLLPIWADLKFAGPWGNTWKPLDSQWNFDTHWPEWERKIIEGKML